MGEKFLYSRCSLSPSPYHLSPVTYPHSLNFMINYIYQQREKRKMVIIQNHDLFEIFIPSVGLFSKFTIFNLVLILFPNYLIQLFFLSLPQKINSQYNHFAWPIVILNLVIAVIAIAIIFLSEFSQKRLSLTRHRASFIYNLFDIKFSHTYPHKIQGINYVSSWNNPEHRPFIEIWSGRNKLIITTDELGLFSITKPELKTLAKELGDWLDFTVIQD